MTGLAADLFSGVFRIFCHTKRMFKLNDKVKNQRGNVGVIVSIRAKGCKDLIGVDFGRITRFFQTKDLKKV